MNAPLRRSFAEARQVEAGARFEPLNDGQVAVSYANATDEQATARRLGLADLSPLGRIGFKGAGTCDWLASKGLTIPEAPNRAAVQSDGRLALRLADQEIFLTAALSGTGEAPAELEAAWNRARKAQRGFPLPRQDTHAWFLVTGEQADSLFAKLCGVDLRPAHFADLEIAQTSIARMSGVICRQDLGGTLAYHLLADSASAHYLWGCLLDGMQEFHGGPVGLHAVQALAKA
ncbi:MAG: sarcosine oxidase [Pseudomonadota bacterium]